MYEDVVHLAIVCSLTLTDLSSRSTSWPSRSAGYRPRNRENVLMLSDMVDTILRSLGDGDGFSVSSRALFCPHLTFTSERKIERVSQSGKTLTLFVSM